MSEIMSDTRETISPLSARSEGHPQCANSMEVIHVLYQKLEPQMTPSYRLNATYVPPTEIPYPERRSKGGRQTPVKGGKSVKTAQLVIGAVAELQKRTETSKRKQLLLAEVAKKAIALDKAKDASQTLPNLPGSDT